MLQPQYRAIASADMSSDVSVDAMRFMVVMAIGLETLWMRLLLYRVAPFRRESLGLLQQTACSSRRRLDIGGVTSPLGRGAVGLGYVATVAVVLGSGLTAAVARHDEVYHDGGILERPCRRRLLSMISVPYVLE